MNPEIIGYVCNIAFAMAALLVLVPLHICLCGKQSRPAVWIAGFAKKHIPTLVGKVILCSALLAAVKTGELVCYYRLGGVVISFVIASIMKHMI